MGDKHLSPHSIRSELLPLVPLVDLLADFLGPRCEVVLHDFSKPKRTIVCIRNGQLTGRAVGGTITDLGLRMMHRLAKEPNASLRQVNYVTHGKDGRELKSASLIIRDRREAVGALCINLDLSPLRSLQQFLEQLCATTTVSPVDPQREETFVPDFRRLMDEVLDKAMKNLNGIPPGRLQKKEKLAVLQALEQQGVFLLRGAVREVSHRLGLAAPTIYKYLDEQRKVPASRNGTERGRKARSIRGVRPVRRREVDPREGRSQAQ